MSRYLGITPAQVDPALFGAGLTPAWTGALVKAGRELLDREESARIEHTKALLKASAGRI
jgi:hypothetical protein